MSPGGVNDDLAAKCAAALRQAEKSRNPIIPLTESYPGLALEDAYRIQQINVKQRVREGARIVGHKIGLTAKAMQELFGVNEPDYGHLLDSMLHDAAGPLDMESLIDPQIEVEPAFILGKPLKGPGLGIEDVLAATEFVCACFEIIDSRIVDWRIRLQDTVADNGSSARVILGSKRVKPRELSLDDLDTRLEVDGTLVEEGNTRAILGHPANGVAWLANKISEFGVALDAGHIVLPGTCTRSFRIGGHRTATGNIAGLGSVSVELINAPTVPNSSGR